VEAYVDKRNSISDFFSDLTEPRESNKRHKLIDVIAIALCAVICGADTWEEIEEFGRAKAEWFETFLELPHGIPAHDTFARIFASMDPKEFQQAFLGWVDSIQSITKGIIAVDGKTLRRSYKKDKSPIHMVSAWALEGRMVLGQVKTKEKSNEITAIPELLTLLELEGCIVTIDAIGCQKTIAGKIIEKGADYVLGLKGNQSALHEEVEFFFQDCLASDFKGIAYDYHETIDGDHGRIETRRYWTARADWLPEREEWENLSAIVMAQRERYQNGETSVEFHYYITSMESNAKKIAEAVRGHWGIENSLHWVLDIAFREDECRIRKDHAPANFAVLRHMALNLLRKENSKRRSIKTKRLRAGWDTDYLGKILEGSLR
jgi:predicted transposase YbfD/YdcC